MADRCQSQIIRFSFAKFPLILTMGLNNFAISCNFHLLAVLGVAVSCILKLTGKLRRHFVRYSSACHVLWHSTLSVRKMDQMKTLLNFQTLCVRSWVFRFICCLPYFHNYFLVCLRCVVLLFMFLFVFFFTFFCAKKKRSFRFQLFATIIILMMMMMMN